MFIHFQVEAIDTICHGLDFCIVNCDKKTQSVQELENMVRRHGGKVVQYPSMFNFILIQIKKSNILK